MGWLKNTARQSMFYLKLNEYANTDTRGYSFAKLNLRQPGITEVVRKVHNNNFRI